MIKEIKKLEFIELLNGLVFFSPVALLVRTKAGVTLSEFFILQAILSVVIFIFEVPTGMITDKIGYKHSLVLSQGLLFTARTLLLVGFLSKSLSVFVIEAIVEGISSCFVSGTSNAYLYSMCAREEYPLCAAKVNNYGTAGFIISTVSFALLSQFGGISVLIIATMICCLLAIPCTVSLEREKKKALGDQPKTEKITSFFRDKTIAVLVLFTAAFSMCGIIVNFFYVEKLTNLGMNQAWMSGIIILYSTFQMFGERILDKTKEEKYRFLMLASALAAGLMMIAFALIHTKYLVIFIMVFMPLFLTIPEYIEDGIVNLYIDEHHQQDRRATILSVMNMSGNLFEIVFLLASAIVVNLGISLCFTIAGVWIMLASILVFRRSKGLYKPAENKEENINQPE